MKIDIRTSKLKNMRYPTVGDWYYEDDVLNIRAVGAGDHAFLIALHELVEAWLCKRRNISQLAVDNFDMAFKGDGEPGDSPEAPYRREHRFAMLIEHLMAHELGITHYGDVR